MHRVIYAYTLISCHILHFADLLELISIKLLAALTAVIWVLKWKLKSSPEFRDGCIWMHLGQKIPQDCCLSLHLFTKTGDGINLHLPI